MKTGVPQCSLLGPLLFNIYINDMARLSLQSEVFMYVDDTAVVLACAVYNDSTHALQRDI